MKEKLGDLLKQESSNNSFSKLQAEDAFKKLQAKANRLSKIKKISIKKIYDFMSEADGFEILVPSLWIDIDYFYQTLYYQTLVVDSDSPDARDLAIIDFIDTMDISVFYYYQEMYEADHIAMAECFGIEAIATLIRTGKIKVSCY